MKSDITKHYSASKFVSDANAETERYEVRPCGRRHSFKLKCAPCVENREKAGKERRINEIGPDFREWIYARDGNACVNCGRDDPLAVDHIVPVISGGKTDPDNLQTLCVPCNMSKGSRSWEQFRRKNE